MGRAKLQIKRIENTTNRQVTFSKRRNGLIKKAYELSVLCGVDVALIMFSPSGRLSLFSGNKSIEEVLARYINLPEHNRGRLHNQEFLRSLLVKLKMEAERTNQANSASSVASELERVQQELIKYTYQLEDMGKRLRMYEGDFSEVRTLCEAEIREQILKATLEQVSSRKQELEEKNKSASTGQISQAHLQPETLNLAKFITSCSSNFLDWFPQRDPQTQILNFLDTSILLPSREQCQEVGRVIPPAASTLLHGQNLSLGDEVANTQSLLDEDKHIRPEIGQLIDVNLSPWGEIYPTEDNPSIVQSMGREFLHLDLPQITSSNIAPGNSG